MDYQLLEQTLQRNYYDLRTNYAWHVVLGRKDELRDDFFPIPDLQSFDVMHRVMDNRTLSIEQFMAICSTNPQLQHLACHYDEQQQILTVRTRTFIFNYFAETWAMDWQVDPEVCQTIRLKLSSWLRQPRSAGLFDPSLLTELDDQLYFRYDSRRQLRDWWQSPQFKADCQLLREMIPFIIEESSRQLLAIKVRESKLNIILEGNDRLRIGMVRYYTPAEMHSLPTYSRQDWMLGIHDTFESLRRWFDDQLDKRHAELENNIQEVREILKPATEVDASRALPIFRQCTDPFSYAEHLFLEALGGPVPPPDLSAWPNDTLIMGSETRIHEILENLRYYASIKHQVHGSTIHIDMDAITVEYDEIDHLVVLKLKEKPLKLLKLQPTIQLGPDDGFIGLDIFALINLNSTIIDSMSSFRKARQCRKQPSHPAMVAAFRTLVKAWTPLLVNRKEDGYIDRNFKVKFRADGSQHIEICLSIGLAYQENCFNLETFENDFRIWWHTIFLTEVKRLKDLSYHPETTFDTSDDAPF